MSALKVGHFVDFYLTVNGFRASASALVKDVFLALSLPLTPVQTAELNETRQREAKKEMQAQGLQIFFQVTQYIPPPLTAVQYLSDTADLRVPLRLDICSEIHQSLLDKPIPTVFDHAQKRVSSSCPESPG